MLIAEFV